MTQLSSVFDGFADNLFEFIDAFVEGGGHGKNRNLADAALKFLEALFGDGFVHFIGNHQARFFEEGGIVEFEFLQKIFVVVPGSAVIGASHVEEQDKDFAALDVTKEFVAEADVAMSALD